MLNYELRVLNYELKREGMNHRRIPSLFAFIYNDICSSLITRHS